MKNDLINLWYWGLIGGFIGSNLGIETLSVTLITASIIYYFTNY